MLQIPQQDASTAVQKFNVLL